MTTPARRALGDGTRVVVHPGAGVVHRSEDALLVVPSVGPGQGAATRELLAACGVSPDPSGRLRARRVAALVSGVEDPDAVPGFVLLLDVDGGPALLVLGDVEATVSGRDEVLVSGRASLAWVEHRIEQDFSSLVLGGSAPAGGAVTADDGAPELPMDLTLGTVPGSGVTVLRAASPATVPAAAKPAPEPAPGPEPVPAQPAQSLPVDEPVTEPVPAPAAALAAEPEAAEPEPAERVPDEMVPDEAGRRDPSVAAQFTVMRPVTQFRNVALGGAAPPARPPLPLAGEAPDRAEAPTVDREVVVEGLTCPAGHLNDPRATTCVLCGKALDPAAAPVRAARPPLGVLVTDDGSVFLLTSDVVIGREPGLAEEVMSGSAQPLQLRDEAHSVSRVHAHVRLSGWEVTLCDSGSSNGTFLSHSGAAGPWLPVEAPTALAPGDRIRLGKRHLMFDRHPGPRATGPGG